MPSVLLRSLPISLKVTLLVSSLLTSLLIAPALQAQTVKAEQQKLQQLQTEQTLLNEQIKQLETTIAAKKAELETAKAKPAPERDELTAADKEIENAKAAYAANPSDMNQTSLKNAEFKRHLAERKYLKNGASTTSLQSDLQELNSRLSELQNSLTANSGKITAQTALIATTEKQVAANAALEKQNAAKQAKAAELAAKEKQAADALAATAAAESATKAKAEQQAAEALAAKLAAEQAAKKAAADANGLKHLTDKTAVAAELARITALQESFWSKGKVNQILYVRRDGSESKNSNTLRDLGHLQYRTELIAPEGKILLNIGFRKWELTFDKNEAGQSVVFIFDQTDAAKPRLVYYLKSLE